MKSTDPGYWEHVAEIRRMVRELPTEDQELGKRLSQRYWALEAALGELSGERPIASEGYRGHTIEVLGELKEEIDALFRSWRKEKGVPDVLGGGQASSGAIRR